MDYLRFLGTWYNLSFVGLVAAGLLAGLARHRRGPTDAARVRVSMPLFLFVAGIAGLTVNGALHDLEIGDFGRWFPFVACSSLAAGWGFAWISARVRRHLFPPVTGVTFNEPGLEGEVAVILSAAIAPGAVGRARVREASGVIHVVRVRAAAGPDSAALGFGGKVRLSSFDEDLRAYTADSV